jgi:hypothetical protein
MYTFARGGLRQRVFAGQCSVMHQWHTSLASSAQPNLLEYRGGLYLKADDESPFYYRIQSPVLIIEFDHHAGVFLGNPTPEKFHIHTLVRTPNGNDYGMDLVRQHCECMQKFSLAR